MVQGCGEKLSTLPSSCCIAFREANMNAALALPNVGARLVGDFGVFGCFALEGSNTASSEKLSAPGLGELRPLLPERSRASIPVRTRCGRAASANVAGDNDCVGGALREEVTAISDKPVMVIARVCLAASAICLGISRNPRLGVLQAGKVLPGGDTIVFDAEAAVVAPLIGRLGDAGSLLLFFGLTAWALFCGGRLDDERTPTCGKSPTSTETDLHMSSPISTPERAASGRR